MKSWWQCISLKRGVTIIGFVSLIICLIEWVLSTTFNAGEDTFSQQLKNKTADVFLLLSKFAQDELLMNTEQIESFTQNYRLVFDCMTGKFRRLILENGLFMYIRTCKS